MERSVSTLSVRNAASIDDLKSVHFWKSIVAELIGTLLLVFVGCGSCVSWEDPNRIPKSDYNPVVQIAFCFGISVATVVWGIGHVSGGHINPAVTSAFLVTRRISLARALFYVAAQCCGAILGAVILKAVVPSQRWGSLGNTMLHAEMTGGGAFGVEFMITFVLVFTVFASCDGKRGDLRGSAPLTIGLSVAMCHFFAIPLTGSSMNSARSFGPAVAMGIWEYHWVYWIGPIFGGVVAGLVYEYVFAANASMRKAKQFLLSSKYEAEDFPVQEEQVNILYDEVKDETKEYVNIHEKESELLVPKNVLTSLDSIPRRSHTCSFVVDVQNNERLNNT